MGAPARSRRTQAAITQAAPAARCATTRRYNRRRTLAAPDAHPHGQTCTTRALAGRGRGRRGAAAAGPRPGLHRPRRRVRGDVVVPGGVRHPAGRGRVGAGLAVPRAVAPGARERSADVAARTADRDRLRRPGSRAHRSLHGRRPAAQLRPARRHRRLPAAADHLPGAVAGGVVVVQHRHAPGPPQHLRLPRSRSPHLPAAAVLDPHRQGRALLPDRQVPDPAPPRRAHQPAALDAVLDAARPAAHLEHHPAGADHLPAGSLLRRRAERDVRARSARHAGHVPALHHPPGQRRLQGRRHPRADRRAGRSRGRRRHRAGERLRRRPSAARSAVLARPRSRRPAGDADHRRDQRRARAGTSHCVDRHPVPGGADGHRGRDRPLPAARDGRARLALRVADQPRPRAAGDADLASAVLRRLPRPAARLVRHARPGRGHLGAQRRRHRRRHLPAAGPRHRRRAAHHVRDGDRPAAPRRPGLRLRRHRSHPAHVLALSRRRPSGPSRRRARPAQARDSRSVREERSPGRATCWPGCSPTTC